MEERKLTYQLRKESGKNASGRLRRNGFIPGNIISGGTSTPITIPEKDFSKLLHSGLRQSSLFDLEMDGKAEKVFVKELTRDPVTSSVLHVDLYKIRPGKKVIVTVSIELTGTAKGVKAGGALEQFIQNIKIKATPESLKDVVKLDITNLDVDEAVHLKDLDIPADWDVLLEGNPLIMKIARSRLTKAEEPAEGTATAAATAGKK